MIDPTVLDTARRSLQAMSHGHRQSVESALDSAREALQRTLENSQESMAIHRAQGAMKLVRQLDELFSEREAT